MLRLSEWLEDALLRLNQTNSLQREEGFTRLCFSEEERKSHKEFRRLAESLHMETREDEVGNQWALLKSPGAKRTIAFGSHLDTVIHGGAFDGVAGVAAALALVYKLQKNQNQLNCNIVIIAFISEESARFGLSTIGSKTIAGRVDKKKWEKLHDDQGISIKEAMEAYGISWGTFDQAYDIPYKIDEFIELHIEQGTQLYKRNLPIGIVKGIATPKRFKLTVRGQANHTGTTSMKERKDALVISATLIQFIEERARKADLRNMGEIVATVSKINLSPSAINVIPGKVELFVDLRSADESLKDAFMKDLLAYIEGLSRKKKVVIEHQVFVDEEAVTLDEDIQKRLKASCEELGLAYLELNSGAGHDAMNMAKRFRTGMIFVPSVDGISHHPEEYTPLLFIEQGVLLLERYLRQIEEDEE